MDRIGGRPLSGEIKVSEAQYTPLELKTAELLADECIVLANGRACRITRQLIGYWISSVSQADLSLMRGVTCPRGGSITRIEAPCDLVGEMRATFLVLGVLLAWLGEVPASLPDCYFDAVVKGRLQCAIIVLPFFSVDATENLLVATFPVEGRTVLAQRCARTGNGQFRCLICGDGHAHRNHC